MSDIILSVIVVLGAWLALGLFVACILGNFIRKGRGE